MMDDSTITDALSVDKAVLDQVPLERLELQITSYAGRLAAAQARWLVWIGAYDRREGWQHWQAKSCAHWLNWRCGVSMRTAREHVRVARRLDELHVVRERFLCGTLSYSKVRALSRVATEFNEIDLVELAELSTASQVERFCGGLRRAQSKLDEAAEAEDAVATQFVSYENNHDGTATITLTVPVADAKVAHASLLEAASAQIEAARRPGQPAADAADELGGLGRIRAETAVALLTGTLAAADGRSEDVFVVVDHDELTNTPDGVAHECSCERTSTIDGERISPLVARRLACDARLQLAIEDAVGDALGIGRVSKVVPRWLRRQLKRRDHGMCQFPGCCAMRRLHAHHIIHWVDGGATELDNLILLCGHHHTSVHEGGWNVLVIDGRRVFIDPTGTIVQVPRLADPAPETPLPAPVSVTGENGSAEPLAASGERYEIPFIVDVIDTTSRAREARAGRGT